MFLRQDRDTSDKRLLGKQSLGMEMLGRDEMILKVRGLNVITGDLIIVWPRNETGEAIKAAFGRRLRKLRTEKGLSQEALALDCDLDRTYIGGIEQR